MKSFHFFGLALLALSINLASCNNAETEKKEPVAEAKAFKLVEQNVDYTGDGINMKGYIAYDGNDSAARPAVLVVHEWWGLTDYPRRRARELAELGYVAMAVDFYGEGKTADNPDSAGIYAKPFYSNAQMTKARFDAAVAKLKTYPQVDGSKLAAIGYCFGGAQVLNLARMGEDLKGVVSFHGNLLGVPLDKSKLKAAMLICHGAADPFVRPAEVTMFRKEMDSIGAAYTFKAYDGALHAFTNPEATELGVKFKLPIKYDAAADTASWSEMKIFLKQVFQ